ncbi:GntR family transcriptional regulator [Niveibacterium microcysteis]|uniref:GntR family transcriptional regulator n=1 Tax=Niveibacterium microcysteis TaxID=2811415 RepID=A0ABX7LZT1_9RHOO|nr:GntR family transcriptional regulator [Niveibacterium microcysteis]QSI75038.1 GntR family transcriptional regulator [Niveibacterium microcysteis]
MTARRASQPKPPSKGGRRSVAGARAAEQPATRAQAVYAAIKDDIAEFRLLPGDRFTETELAERLGVSRTPVREALYQLQREGFLSVQFRNGWSVNPYDFDRFENLYDLRQLIELESVRRLCDRKESLSALTRLEAYWLLDESERDNDGRSVALQDEAFHMALVEAAGNPEMARVHADVTERIRIVRRLDFTQRERIETTYAEHAAILRAIRRRGSERATSLLAAHIEASRAEVRKITLHKLYEARRTGRG